MENDMHPMTGIGKQRWEVASSEKKVASMHRRKGIVTCNHKEESGKNGI
jgi:hypothetical protein